MSQHPHNGIMHAPHVSLPFGDPSIHPAHNEYNTGWDELQYEQDYYIRKQDYSMNSGSFSRFLL